MNEGSIVADVPFALVAYLLQLPSIVSLLKALQHPQAGPVGIGYFLYMQRS